MTTLQDRAENLPVMSVSNVSLSILASSMLIAYSYDVHQFEDLAARSLYGI